MAHGYGYSARTTQFHLNAVSPDTEILSFLNDPHDLYAEATCGMCRQQIQRAKEQWQAFMLAAPPYPEGTFHGQGIAILAGGGRYMVPAWVNIHMLRRTGKSPAS